MRLLMVTFDPTSGSGGIEGRATAYTKILMKRGVCVEVAAFAPGPGSPSEEYHGTRLTRFTSSLGRLPKTFPALVRMSSSSSLDAIFFLSGGSTAVGILTLCFSRLTRRRSGVFFYGKDVLRYRKRAIGRLLLVLSILLANRVGTNSLYTANLLPISPRRRVVVIYPGVDSGLVDAAKDAHGERVPFRILFVGRLVRRKGADLLLTAFSRLSPQMPAAGVDIVGDGTELKSLVEMSERLGLDDSVKFHGALYGRELWDRYAAASLFVLPARESGEDAEGFGTVFLEAGAFGVPSVATRTGGVPEAVIDGVTGRLVESEDVEGLTNAMRELLDDPGERQRLGSNARSRVAEFTWEASTSQVLKLLGEDGD